MKKIFVELLKQLTSDHSLEGNQSRSIGRCLRAVVGVKVQRHPDGDTGLKGKVEFGSFYSLSQTVDVLFQSGWDTKLLLDPLCGVLEHPLAEVLAS